MGQESKPSSKSVNPSQSASVPAAVAKDKRDAATANLIDFNPTPAVKASQPASKSDTAIIRRRIALWTTALAALVLISLVLLLGPKLYRKFKAWRATQFALQGEELVRENRAVDAVPYIRSAYLLSPQIPEVLRAMAQMLTAYSSPEATNYWNWLLLTTDATDDDRRAAIDCAMQYGLFNEASTMIKDLLARSGGDARNQLIAARWDTQRGTPTETMYYATRAVNDDPTYKPAVLFLAAQELANPYLYQKGVDSLFQLAASDDDSGLKALWYLARDPHLKPAEIDRLIARLRSHPLAGETERLAALDLDIKLHPGQRKTLIDQAMAEHQNVAPADQAAFAEWLNLHGEAARVLKLIPREKALSDKSLCFAYLDCLAALKRWDDIKNLLSGATVPIELPLVETYLSRCAGEMGDHQGSELHWQYAVSAAAYNQAQSLQLAIYAENHGQNERAATVYRALTQNPAIANVAYLGLIRVFRDKDLRTQCDLLDQIVSRWPKVPELASQDILLHLLLNEHVEDMHKRAVSLLADDSYNLSLRTNVALACLRLNDPSGALQAYNHALIDWNTVPVTDLIVYAATLNANGHSKAAHRLLVLVNRHALRPELRDLIKSIP